MDKKEASNKQELKIANFLGWSQISGSGSRPFSPGDIGNDHWLGECKTHVKPNHKIKFSLDVWDKISEEAKSQFKRPVLFVDDGSQFIYCTWCMFDITQEFSGQNSTTFELIKNKKSISFYNNNVKFKVKFFIRNQSILVIMKLKDFKEFLELGE